MGWERGRYYTRSKKVNGRVVREYIGAGGAAELAAELDAIESEHRRLEAQRLRQEKEAMDSLDAEIQSMTDLTELLARAALRAAGLHQHKRGEWRKRRVQCSPRD
jgi:predicted phage gp36 major capsid-like protein